MGPRTGRQEEEANPAFQNKSGIPQCLALHYALHKE